MMRKITQERFVFDLPVHGGTTIEFMDPDVVEYMRRVFEDAERYRHIRSNIDAVQALVGPDAVPRLVGGGLKELGRYCDECIDNVMRSSGRVSDE